MIDFLVYSAFAAAIALVLAWAISPRLRSRIEAPKFAFQDRISKFERNP